MKKARKQHFVLKHKKRLVAGLLGLVLLAAVVTAAWVYVKPASGLILTITSRHDEYDTSRYAIFEVELKNTSHKPIATPFGTCAEAREVLIDDIALRKKPTEPYAICAIGYGDLAPGKSEKGNIKLNLLGLDSGEHTLEIKTGVHPIATVNGKEVHGSSTARISFKVRQGDQSVCAGFTDYELTHCDQIEITNGTGTYGDSKDAAIKRCEFTKEKYFSDTKYKPIASVGTSSCNWWNTQLVFNVDPSDTKKVFAELNRVKGFRTNIQISNTAERNVSQFSKEWLEYVEV